MLHWPQAHTLSLFINNRDLIILQYIKTFRWVLLHLTRALCKGQQYHHENTYALSAHHTASANIAVFPLFGITCCKNQDNFPPQSTYPLSRLQIFLKQVKIFNSIRRFMLKRPENTTDMYLALVWWCRLLIAASAATHYTFTERKTGTVFQEHHMLDQLYAVTAETRNPGQFSKYINHSCTSNLSHYHLRVVPTADEQSACQCPFCLNECFFHGKFSILETCTPPTKMCLHKRNIFK